MMRLALDGLTSTSIQPLRWGLLLGGCSILLGVGLSVWALYRHLIVGQTVSGWTSLMVVVLFFMIPGTFWFGRFDVVGKMVQIEETNVGIAYVLARLGDEDMGHFSPQKSARIKRTGYSIQFILMGLMGEYIGKIFLQVRGRPGNIVMENNGTDPGGTYTAPDRHSWAQRNNQREKKSRNTKNRSAGSFHPNETWQPP